MTDKAEQLSAVDKWGYPSGLTACKKHCFTENISLCGIFKNGTDFVFPNPILGANTCRICLQQFNDRKEKENYEKSDRPKFN